MNYTDIKHVSRFFGLCCHKIIPLVYDNALSYYEVLCRVNAKLNEVIDAINGLIDSDIEGYIKELVDEYASEEVIKLINEIGEPMIREIATGVIDDILSDWEDRLDSVEDSVDDIAPIVKTSGTKEYTFNREHYLWLGSYATTYSDPDGNPYRKVDLVLVGNNYYYYIAHADDSEYYGCFRVNRETYSISKIGETDGGASSHGTYGEDGIYMVANGRIRVRSTSDFSFIKTYVQDPFVGNADPGTDYIGHIAYDRKTGKYYGNGAMRSGNAYSVYELTFSDDPDIFTVNKLFDFCDQPIMGIIQNMDAYDGMLYVGVSNPNQILCVDIEQQKIVNVVNVGDRLDRIIPVGELQGVSCNGGKLFISGYNSLCVSGIRYLCAIGSVDVTHGNILNVPSIGPQNYDIYVSRDETDIAAKSPGSIHGFTYDRYKNANGWSGGYDYLPFYHLWEAVECAVGLFQYSGKKSTISIGDTTHYGETDIPSWAVSEIRGRKENHLSSSPSTYNIYARVRYLNVFGGGSVTLTRIGITGRRRPDWETTPSTDNLRGTAGVLVDGSTVTMTNCCFLRISGSTVFAEAYESLIRTVNNGRFLATTFESYDNWVGAVSDWTGHMGEGTSSPNTKFAIAETGELTYYTSDNVTAGYLDLPVYKYKTARLNLIQNTSTSTSYLLLS